jgi:hypothetical protein
VGNHFTTPVFFIHYNLIPKNYPYFAYFIIYRKLTSQTTVLMVNRVIPELLKNLDETKDLYLKHGSVVAVGSVVIGLGDILALNKKKLSDYLGNLSFCPNLLRKRIRVLVKQYLETEVDICFLSFSSPPRQLNYCKDQVHPGVNGTKNGVTRIWWRTPTRSCHTIHTKPVGSPFSMSK